MEKRISVGRMIVGGVCLAIMLAGTVLVFANVFLGAHRHGLWVAIGTTLPWLIVGFSAPFVWNRMSRGRNERRD